MKIISILYIILSILIMGAVTVNLIRKDNNIRAALTSAVLTLLGLISLYEQIKH